jgi:hypothetical protein
MAALAVTTRHVRSLLLVLAVVEIAAALLLALQVPWVVALPPFAGRSAMSNTFLASFLMASAAATVWCLAVHSSRGFAGIGLDTLVIFGGIALVLLIGDAGAGGTTTPMLGLVAILVSVASGWLLRWALRHPWTDPRPTPPLVVGSFALFVVALLIVGVLLVMRVPNVLPWRITPELSLLYGAMFLGASSYYAYGLLDRRWENAGGQLAAFLAYDLVLIVPFTRQLLAPDTSVYDVGDGSVPVNLVLYIGVIVYSGVLAIHYLFLSSATRLGTHGSTA